MVLAFLIEIIARRAQTDAYCTYIEIIDNPHASTAPSVCRLEDDWQAILLTELLGLLHRFHRTISPRYNLYTCPCKGRVI